MLNPLPISSAKLIRPSLSGRHLPGWFRKVFLLHASFVLFEAWAVVPVTADWSCSLLWLFPLMAASAAASFTLLFCFLALLRSILLLPFRNHRGSALSLLIAATACIAILPLSGRLGWSIRSYAFNGVAARSTVLIQAIEAYSRLHGHPPRELTDLVPKFLDRVPSTGLGAYPHYRYLSGRDARTLGGQPWVLVIDAPTGHSFDLFLYSPGQAYPDSGFGGVLEPIRDWAYVHE